MFQPVKREDGRFLEEVTLLPLRPQEHCWGHILYCHGNELQLVFSVWVQKLSTAGPEDTPTRDGAIEMNATSGRQRPARPEVAWLWPDQSFPVGCQALSRQGWRGCQGLPKLGDCSLPEPQVIQ